MIRASVPKNLKRWFIIHGIIDLFFAIPLIAIPEVVLQVFGFQIENVLIARMVGAALCAIGISSLLSLEASRLVYDAFLTLKIIWSLTVILSIFLALTSDNTPNSIWLLLGIFGFFSGVWIYYKVHFKSR